MANIRLDIEYDGSDYFGWQRQPELRTIQATIEDVISQVLDRRTTLYGAGRTDSGVHAKGQVANFFADCTIPPDRWDYVLNTKLPNTIRIQHSAQVPDSFHAQKNAVSKIYEYRLLNRRNSSALDRRVYFYPGRLDWAKIYQSLRMFTGEKDFRSFQGAKSCVQFTVRRVFRFELFEEQEGYFRFEIEGNGFLKQMVRNIIGTVLEIGEGKRSIEDIDSVFAAMSRQSAGRTAPAEGLSLVKVCYLEVKEDLSC